MLHLASAESKHLARGINSIAGKRKGIVVAHEILRLRGRKMKHNVLFFLPFYPTFNVR